MVEFALDNNNQSQAQAGSSRPSHLEQNNSIHPPPHPVKQAFVFSEYEDSNNQSVSIAIESGKEATKESKSASKAVTKTYHTLKDIISSKFKGKDTSSESKTEEPDSGLNNVSEEARKSLREQANKQADQSIYGRPTPQQRESPYERHIQIHQPNNSIQYRSQMQQQYNRQSPLVTQQQQQQFSPPPQQMMSTQQQQFMLGHGHGPSASSTPQHTSVQSRTHEMLNRQNMEMQMRQQMVQQQQHQQMAGPDAIYYQPQYGAPPPPRSNVNGRLNNTNYETQQQIYGMSKPGPSSQQIEDTRSIDVRSPQQLEREILRQKGLDDNKRTASQPQLPLDEDKLEARRERITPTAMLAEKAVPLRRSSHGNLLETISKTVVTDQEKDSDDGGFRQRSNNQGRSFDIKDRSTPNHLSSRVMENGSKVSSDGLDRVNKNEAIYGSGRGPVFNGIPKAAQRHIESTDEGNTLNMLSKKVNPGSTASSDYDKNGGPSSNVDSGRGSAVYSSGRRVGHDTSTESDPIPTNNQGRPANGSEQISGGKNYNDKNGESEWVDIVESELRQILEPKLHGLSIGVSNNRDAGGAAASESASSVTPPLPPLSPNGSTPDATPRNSTRFKHQSLPYGTKPEYPSEPRNMLPNQRSGWQHTPKHRSNTSKKQEQSHQYKKHMFGFDNTDITSTTTRSLDLSSMLDGQSDSDVSTQDARAIRRQLQGLENMYCEVLKLLGVRKPSNHNLGKYQPSDPRLSKRRYGSMSSLPSSSVSSRPLRDKRRAATEQRKKVNDIKGINKRFQRLESHVVTLARSVAHLSSEMRTQHLMIQEMENIRGEITALRNQQRSLSMPRIDSTFCPANNNTFNGMDVTSLANPARVKKLTKFFGDEPPLLRMFLKKLGYEKYATLLENERVGAAELPFLGEERLRALGVPLGPRLRILHEARLALPPANSSHTTLCIV